MLTDLLLLLSPFLAHLLLRLLRVKAEDFHEWMTGFCPCGVLA